jgi:hypothetical protein
LQLLYLLAQSRVGIPRVSSAVSLVDSSRNKSWIGKTQLNNQ